MKTAQDFLRRWKEQVGGVLAQGYKVAEIEVCLGTDTAKKFCANTDCILVLGFLQSGDKGICYWSGVRIRVDDAPRLLVCRPTIQAKRARQKARK